MGRNALLVVTAIAVLCLFIGLKQGDAQQNLKVRVDRWLEVRQVASPATLQQGTTSRPAQAGDRLQNLGDAIATGPGATAILFVDTGIGVVNVSENTQVRIERFGSSPDGGRITYLNVPQGQVRLKIRPFTNRGSEFRIRTPAGLSGVRGTEFGLAVQPQGKTGLAVLQGGVNSSAHGASVPVRNGFQNFTIPGEVPSRPVPLKNDTGMQYQLEKVIESGIRKVKLVGQTDPVNSVIVEGIPQATDRNGRFVSSLIPVSSFLKIQVVVTTPLGKTKTYELALQ